MVTLYTIEKLGKDTIKIHTNFDNFKLNYYDVILILYSIFYYYFSNLNTSHIFYKVSIIYALFITHKHRLNMLDICI